MEKELNYLSDKIEEIEHRIDLCEFGIGLNVSTPEELEELQKEKVIIENILNEITVLELDKTK